MSQKCFEYLVLVFNSRNSYFNMDKIPPKYIEIGVSYENWHLIYNKDNNNTLKMFFKLHVYEAV